MSVDPRQSLWYRTPGDVAILRWPEQEQERAELARRGLPRLLVIDEDAAPPEVASCLEDWLRLPVSDDDLHTRVDALRAHARRHPPQPELDHWGVLTYHGSAVFLSPTEHAVAEPLLEHFRSGVSEHDLLARAWPDGQGAPAALRVQIHRLRKRVAPLDLTVRTLRGRGYVMLPRSESNRLPSRRH